MNVRTGVIGSSAGSALAAAYECIVSAGHTLDLVILTDRECGLSEWASKKKFANCIIPFMDKSSFSSAAYSYFKKNSCEDILLFYTRLLTKPLIDNLSVWNIHPALLPAFRGLRGVEDACEYDVPILGASLHRVDEGMDTGPIFAQVATARSKGLSLRASQRLSYLQKVWLILVWYEHQARVGESFPVNRFVGQGIGIASPMIVDNALIKAYRAWESELHEKDPVA